MKVEKSLTEKVTEAIAKGKVQYSERRGTLTDTYAKFSKIGIVTKSTYSFPLKDTLGKTFRDQIQFTNK